MPVVLEDPPTLYLTTSTIGGIDTVLDELHLRGQVSPQGLLKPTYTCLFLISLNSMRHR